MSVCLFGKNKFDYQNSPFEKEQPRRLCVLRGYVYALKRNRPTFSSWIWTKGRAWGRKQVILPDDFPQVCESCRTGTISMRTAAKILSLNYSTFRRKYREYCEHRN